MALPINPRAAATPPGKQVGGTGEGASAELEHRAWDGVDEPVSIWVGVEVSIEYGWGRCQRGYRLGKACPPLAAELKTPVPHGGQRGIGGLQGRAPGQHIFPAVDRGVALRQVLGTFAPLPLAVGQEAVEEGQVDAVMKGQQEVTGQLEAGGVLRPQLPHTVQEK